MEWWYKNNRYSISSENTDKLEDALMSFLRQGNKPSIASLFEDKKNFFIKTTNKTFLQPFLAEQGFEELYEKPKSELSLLFGKN